jgi:ketosteroid isomerase-like protein
MSEENVQIIRDLYEAFGNGDVPGVLSKLANNIEWREADNFIYSDGNPYLGPTAVLEGVFMRFATEWDNFAAHADSIVGAGDHVIALGTYSGTYKKTGKSISAQMAHVWDIKDGRAVKFQQYTDTKQFADATS